MLTPQEFKVYLDRKGVNPDCPACGHGLWVFDPDNPTVALPGLKDARMDEQNVVPTIATICQRCGFVRLHALDFLLGDN